MVLKEKILHLGWVELNRPISHKLKPDPVQKDPPTPVWAGSLCHPYILDVKEIVPYAKYEPDKKLNPLPSFLFLEWWPQDIHIAS